MPDESEQAVLTARCWSSDREFLAILSGGLAGDAARDFGEILLLESWRELERIALDLSEVTFVDLVGMSWLSRMADAQDAGGRRFEVQSLSPTVDRRIRSMGLTDRIPVGLDGDVRARLSHAHFDG